VVGSTAYAANVWHDVGVPYIATGSPTIHSGGSLSIDDGVEVRFENGVYFNVNGTLDATGTSGDGVLFTRRDATDEWSGLQYNSTAGGLLQYCTIEHATRYDGIALYANGALPGVEHCLFRNNDTGLYCRNVETPALSVPNTFQDNILGIRFDGCTDPSVSNQTLTGHTSDYGAIFMDRTGEFHLGTGNVVTGNLWGLTMSMDAWPGTDCDGRIPTAGNTNTDGLKVVGSTAYAANVWHDVGVPYIATGSPTIHSGGGLSIDDGVEVRFENGVYFNVNGTLDATGTSGDGVLFTRRDATDEWSGLQYNSTAGGLLQYCTIEHATRYDGIALYANGALPGVEHCLFRNNDTGLYCRNVETPALSVPNTFQDNILGIRFDGCTDPSVSNQTLTGHTSAYGAIYMDRTGEFHLGTGNVVTGNLWGLVMNMDSYPASGCAGHIPMAGNTHNDGIRVYGGTAYGANTWRNVGAPYIVTHTPTIHSGGSLSIRSDAELRFETGVYLNVNGSLSVNGVINHPVLMTRRHATDEWSGVQLNSSSNAALRYCNIEHVTRYNGTGVYVNGCAPLLERCLLSLNDTGLYAVNASPRFVNCTITGNYQYGIQLSGASTPDFGTTLGEWNDIHGNGPGDPDRDLVNGTEDIYARYVWWGTIVRSEIEDMVHHEFDDAELGRVIFSPWTDAAHDSLYYWIWTGVDEPADPLPRAFALAQNHPNPFNPATTIEYALPEDARVRLEVYDVTGRRVARLLDERQAAGFKSLRWDAGDLPSGIYFYRIEAGDFRETRRMVLVK